MPPIRLTLEYRPYRVPSSSASPEYLRKKPFAVNILSLESGEDELRADHAAVDWVINDGVQRRSVGEAVLRDAVDRDIGVSASDFDGDVVSVEVAIASFRTRPNFPDDQVRPREFLGVLVLGEVVVSKSRARSRAHANVRFALEDSRFRRCW